MTEPVRTRKAPPPELITDAPISYADELAARKRRYAVMMGMRIPLMVAAVFLVSTPWLAASLLVLSIPFGSTVDQAREDESPDPDQERAASGATNPPTTTESPT